LRGGLVEGEGGLMYDLMGEIVEDGGLEGVSVDEYLTGDGIYER
jgi:hypothetical protein